MDRTAHLSAYMRSLFVKEMGGNTCELKMPKTLSLDLLEECHYAVRLVIRAIGNQSESLDVLITIFCGRRPGPDRTNPMVGHRLCPPSEEAWIFPGDRRPKKTAISTMGANGIGVRWLCSHRYWRCSSDVVLARACESETSGPLAWHSLSSLILTSKEPEIGVVITRQDWASIGNWLWKQ